VDSRARYDRHMRGGEEIERSAEREREAGGERKGQVRWTYERGGKRQREGPIERVRVGEGEAKGGVGGGGRVREEANKGGEE
jgi:hypothetical protein